MKRLTWNSIGLAGGLLMVPAVGGAQTVDVNDAVIRWLQTRAQPIARVAPVRDQSDLQFLKPLLGGVRVVGLGEGSHGTREFFQLKHRLVEFLVTELDFTTLAMEASASDIEPLNDYVLHGRGDLEEVTAMMAWLPAYNARVPHYRKVQVVGLDILMNTRGRARVLQYLREHAPARAAETEALFKTLAEEQARLGAGYRRDRVAACLPRLEALRDSLLAAQQRDGRTGVASRLETVISDVQRLTQLIRFAIPADASGHLGRSQALGRNLV